jgi:sarcosine oxidase
MRVAVVGGGIYGQVIAWRLAVRGHHATVIEPVGPGNARSQSGDRSRIVRAFCMLPESAESGRLSLELYARWSDELGVRLLEPTGVVYLHPSCDAARARALQASFDRAVADMLAQGITLHHLTGREAARRFPALSAESLESALFEPGGGMGRPSRAARAIARAGLATGRVAHVGAVVQRVLEEGGVARGVAVRTLSPAGGMAEIAADAVVIAAGVEGASLIAPFVGDLGIRRVTNWASYWDVPYPEGVDLSMDRLPVWVDLSAPLYGFPDDGENGIKIAWHDARGTMAAAQTADGTPTPAQLEGLLISAGRFFPGLQHAMCRSTFPCTYDVTPDQTFRVGPVPGVAGLYFVGGLSGLGFKHAPSLGDSLAALVVGEEPALCLSPYALTGVAP